MQCAQCRTSAHRTHHMRTAYSLRKIHHHVWNNSRDRSGSGLRRPGRGAAAAGAQRPLERKSVKAPRAARFRKMHRLSRAQRSYGKGHRLALGSRGRARPLARAARALEKRHDDLMIISLALSTLRNPSFRARSARFRKKASSLARAARLGNPSFRARSAL